MTDRVINALQRAVTAAKTYVDIVNNPCKSPLHKAVDAERNAFDDLEDAVREAIDATKAEKSAVVSEEEGAWS